MKDQRMRGWGPRRNAAMLACALLLYPLLSRGYPPSRMGGAFPATGIGGIRICVSGGELADIPRLQYDPQAEQLQATLSNGERSQVALTPMEAYELMVAVGHDDDGCVEVSFDPIGSISQASASEELRAAETIRATWTLLDHGIHEFLEGGYLMAHDERSLLPSVVARELIETNEDYQGLLVSLSSAPSNWHESEIHVDPHTASQPSLEIKVDPTPIVWTAYQGRVELRGQDRELATRPYRPLIARFEETPERYLEVVEGLSDGLRYARAFGLLASCWHSCWSDLVAATDELGLSELARAESEQRGESTRETEELLQRSIKRSHLEAIWREYRMTRDPRDLTEAARIAIYVDEAFERYGSISRAERVAMESGIVAPGELRKFLEGLDVEASEHRGWIYLATFIVDTWEGRPWAELVASLSQARQRAEAQGDLALEYQTLKVFENLAPVVESNLFIAERQGLGDPVVVADFNISGPTMESSEMSSRAYVAHLSANSAEAIRQFLRSEHQRLEPRVAGLLGAEDVNLCDAFALQGDFQYSHLATGRLQFEDPVLRQRARISYLIARASMLAVESGVEPQDLPCLKLLKFDTDDLVAEAKNRLRLLRSMERVAEHLKHTEVSEEIAHYVEEIDNALVG